MNMPSTRGPNVHDKVLYIFQLRVFNKSVPNTTSMNLLLLLLYYVIISTILFLLLMLLDYIKLICAGPYSIYYIRLMSLQLPICKLEPIIIE